MEMTKEQIKKVEEIVNEKIEEIENWTIEQIEEPIFTEQVEIGEIEKENFYEAVTGMGLPYIKKGRIPYEEFEKLAPRLLEFFKDSVNPKSDVKDALSMKTLKGVKKINDRINRTSKIRKRDKKPKIERNELIHKELGVLEEKKVKVNRSLMWSIYTIKRGEKRLERFEEDGKDIELLKLQNSFIDEEIMEELKERRSEYYENGEE